MLDKLDCLAFLFYDFFERERDQVSFRLRKFISLYLKVETEILEHVFCDTTLLDQLDHELPILDEFAREVIFERLVHLVTSHVGGI